MGLLRPTWRLYRDTAGIIFHEGVELRPEAGALTCDGGNELRKQAGEEQKVLVSLIVGCVAAGVVPRRQPKVLRQPGQAPFRCRVPRVVEGWCHAGGQVDSMAHRKVHEQADRVVEHGAKSLVRTSWQPCALEAKLFDNRNDETG